MKNSCAGIHVLVKKGAAYLILRRSEKDDADAGCWDLPGGGIGFGEQPLAAAKRETKEEAGINIAISKVPSVWTLNYQKQWTVEINILAKYLSGKIKLSTEHSDYRWVTKKELLSVKPKAMTLKALPKHI